MAGCTAPEIPDDAVTDLHDAVPDGQVFGWLREGNSSTQIIGSFTYDGLDSLTVNWVQPLGYWNLTIWNGDGQEVLYDDRPSRKAFNEILQGPFHEDFYFTWQHNEFERYQRAGTYDDIPDHPVAAGNYTAILQFLVDGQPDDAFEVRLPITVS
jgi:hypothetical protein